MLFVIILKVRRLMQVDVKGTVPRLVDCPGLQVLGSGPGANGGRPGDARVARRHVPQSGIVVQHNIRLRSHQLGLRRSRLARGEAGPRREAWENAQRCVRSIECVTSVQVDRKFVCNRPL